MFSKVYPKVCSSIPRPTAFQHRRNSKIGLSAAVAFPIIDVGLIMASVFLTLQFVR